MLLIGCDVSLRSPAFVVHSTQLECWRAYVWPQRRKDRRVTNPDIVVFEKNLTPAKDETVDAIRYNEIATVFTDVILAYCRSLQQISGEPIHVVFEGYAYGSQSAHTAKLHEITGILKYLACAYPQIIIAASSWKKTTLGSGRAAKNDGLQHIKTHGPKWDLCADFDMPELTPDEIKNNKEPKTPLQDISDAVCLTLAYVTSGNAAPETSKKRKLKGDHGKTKCNVKETDHWSKKKKMKKKPKSKSD